MPSGQCIGLGRSELPTNFLRCPHTSHLARAHPGPAHTLDPPCSSHSPALLPAYAGPLLTPFLLLGMPSPPLIHGLLQLQSHLHHETFPSSFLLELISIPSNLMCSRLCYMQYERVCTYLLSVYVCVCAHTHACEYSMFPT